MSYENDTKYQEYLKSPKWHKIAKKRIEIDKYTCQGCGSHGLPDAPLEIHHLTYSHKYHEEDYIYTDLVCLCRLCHKNLHRIMQRRTNAQGRRGWSDNPLVPNTPTYTINGLDLEYETMERME